MRLKILMALSLMLSLGLQSTANAGEKPEKHKTGEYSFEKPGMIASIYVNLLVDYGLKDPGFVASFKSGKVFYAKSQGKAAFYNVMVPKSYRKGWPYGLVVFVDSTDGGIFPGQYKPLLEQYHFIGIAPKNAGNSVSPNHRQTLALSAVQHMKETHDIDEARIYITGRSGGGRLASHAMIMNADVFKGGFPLIGANPCIPMRNVGSKGIAYQDNGNWVKPNAKILAMARDAGRFVFLTGSKDFNRENVKAVYEGYQKGGFKNVLYLEQPGLDHHSPSVEYAQKAIEFIERPVVKLAEQGYNKAKKLESEGKFAQAHQEYKLAYLRGTGSSFAAECEGKIPACKDKADKDSEAALSALKLKNPDKKQLRQYIETWNGFSGEAEARTALDSLAQKELTALMVGANASTGVKLKKFMTEWDGYPVYEEALLHLDNLAKLDFAKVSGISNEKSKFKAFCDFYEKWKPARTTDAEWEKYEIEIKGKLDQIRQNDNKTEKTKLLKAFISNYKDTDCAREAKELLEELGAK